MHVSSRVTTPPHRDLYWEQRHEKVPYPLKHDEEGDTKMQDYPLPEKVETLLEQGKYNNVENKITKVERGGERGGGWNQGLGEELYVQLSYLTR